MSGFVFHPEASRDLEDIWDFIARDSLDAADATVEKILAAAKQAGLLPNQGHRRLDLAARPLRFLTVYEYLVAYAAEEQPIWVIAILHGRRHPRVMAAILRGRVESEW